MGPLHFADRLFCYHNFFISQPSKSSSFQDTTREWIWTSSPWIKQKWVHERCTRRKLRTSVRMSVWKQNEPFRPHPHILTLKNFLTPYSQQISIFLTWNFCRQSNCDPTYCLVTHLQQLRILPLKSSRNVLDTVA